MEDTKIITMPVIALRGLTMLPEMTISFDISRKKSIAAVEKAMVSDQRVCLVAQKDPEIQDPTLEQLCHMARRLPSRFRRSVSARISPVTTA